MPTLKEARYAYRMKALAFVQGNPEISLEEVARMCHISKVSLIGWMRGANLPRRKRGPKAKE
jgi:hypothetical protein